MQRSGPTTKRETFATVKAAEKITRVAHNTWEYFRDGLRVIRLHFTDILLFESDDRVTLQSGGWQTVTTKDRMNKFLKGYRVYAEKGIWYVYKLSNNMLFPENRIPYYDGMILPDAFDEPQSKQQQLLDDQKALRRQIHRFVNLLDKMDKVPEPDPGDCLECKVFNEGELTCLKSHLYEKYLHGTLIVNAMRHVGYQDFQIPVHYMFANEGRKDRSTIKRALRRYLYAKLGLAR